MKKHEELKMLEKCLFYYNLPRFIIELRTTIFGDNYINKGFCYFFTTRFSLEIPKSLKLAYIGSKYYQKDNLSHGYWLSYYSYSKKERLAIRIKLLRNAIKNLKNELR